MVTPYRVRRWTAFAWSDSRDRQPAVMRAARLLERNLRERFPAMDATVAVVRMRGRPQMVFEGTVYGTTPNEAKSRACLRFEQAMVVKAGEQNVQLSIPWGKVAAERLDA